MIKKSKEKDINKTKTKAETRKKKVTKQDKTKHMKAEECIKVKQQIKTTI